MAYLGKKIAVVGFGKTGRALLDFLLDNHGCDTLYLYNDTPIEAPEKEAEDYEARGVTFLVSEYCFSRLEEVELIILSPGVDGRTERFDQLRGKGVSIISEIEFASSFINAPVIAVTGTNGKSTTVSLIHHFLNKNGINSFLTGNIGTPLISEVGSIPRDAVVVLEVSSFQLEEIRDFKPYIAVILNVTPDHMDRYKGLEDYFASKLNIVKNQESSDYLILNQDDPQLKKRGDSMGEAQKVWFSRLREDLDTGAWMEETGIRIKIDTINEWISLSKNPLRGVHNLENLLASVTAARLMGVSAEGIETAVADFKGLPHRMEYAGKIGDVEFINDSKATNVDATLKSINSIKPPLVLILGGKDKGSDFTILGEAIRQRAAHVLLVGDAAPTILQQLGPMVDKEKCSFVPDFAGAVARGYQLLEDKGGVVLLAPGCASFDMFRNFEHRGEVFKEEVLKLSRSTNG